MQYIYRSQLAGSSFEVLIKTCYVTLGFPMRSLGNNTSHDLKITIKKPELKIRITKKK